MISRLMQCFVNALNDGIIFMIPDNLPPLFHVLQEKLLTSHGFKKVTLDNISEQLEAIQGTLENLDVDCSCLSENELENMLQRLFVNKVTPPTVPVLFSMPDNQEKWISPPFYTHPRGYKMVLVILRIRPEPPSYYSRYGGAANSPDDPSGWYANFSLLQGEYDDYLRFPIRMSIVLHVMKKATNESRSITVHFNDKHYLNILYASWSMIITQTLMVMCFCSSVMN